MPSIKLKNQELAVEVTGRAYEFPKYTTQIINLANQNAQGTRPKVVGQMSELFQQFGGNRYEDWETWYLARKPTAVRDAASRVFAMIENLKEAILLIDKGMVEAWVEDLVLAKTFVGMGFQQSILAHIAKTKKTAYRMSTPEEESRGIDGFIGGTAVSVKPSTYQTKEMLGESIEGKLVLYEKKKDGITFTYDF